MTHLQIHLAAVLIIEDLMREAGIDPDKEQEPVKTLESDADFDAFFGR